MHTAITLTLNSGEYLSHKREDIFTHKTGIHFINAKTGAGKTSMMIDQSLAIKGGAICSPMININKQIEHDKNERAAMMTGVDSSHCEIIQLEHLVRMTAHDIACTYKILFIDECHHFLTDIYRPVFVEAARIIREAARHIPVYMMSATVPDVEFLPFDVQTVFDVQSSFSRETTVVRFPTNGKITSNTKKIAHTVAWAHEQHKIPALVFINDISRAFSVQRLLKENGLNTVVIQSKTGQLNSKDQHTDPEAARVLKTMIETSSLSATGVDVAICTITLAEGINVNDTITVISCQASPEQLFQQHGRARKDGYHYVITGGADIVMMNDDGEESRTSTGLQQVGIKGAKTIESAKVVIKTADGLEFDADTGLIGEIIESQRQNKWLADSRMKAIGDVYPLYQGLQQEGRFANQVMIGLGEKGYRIVDVFDFDEVRAKRKANKKPTPTRREVFEAALQHGLPETGTADADHPFNIQLLYSDKYDPAETRELLDPIFEFVPHAQKHINLYQFDPIDFYFSVSHKQAMFILDVFRQESLIELRERLVSVAQEMRATVKDIADEHGKRFDSERLEIIGGMFSDMWLQDAITIFNRRTNGKTGEEQEAIQRGNNAMIAYLCGLRRSSPKAYNWEFDEELNPLFLKLERAEQIKYRNLNNTAKKEGAKQNVELTADEVITHHNVSNRAVIQTSAKERRELCTTAAEYKANAMITKW
ncbi:MAG: hypothetical protein ACRDBF_14670 [Plesiomonas shigelloides]